MQKYTMTTEEKATIFDRRIKLLELIILTITAIIIIISFTNIRAFIWPTFILFFDIILLVIAVIVSANKKLLETTFTDDLIPTKIEISYKLESYDIVAFSLYILAMLSLSYIFLCYFR
jgi:hypothetical protein